MRLKGKTAIVIGAGQGPGEGMGNGRATVLRFAQEGAKVMAVDRDLRSAEETASMVKQSGGECVAFEADVTQEATLAAAISGGAQSAGAASTSCITTSVSASPAAMRRCSSSLRKLSTASARSTCAAPSWPASTSCRSCDEQRAGAIIMISSLAALENYPFVAYKATKAALIAFTKQVAIQNAEFGIRANVILPGLIDTPMAVDTRARVSGKSRAEVAVERDARVPLRRKMGTAWDVANAALFLASDEANFITGVALLVDGGGALNIG